MTLHGAKGLEFDTVFLPGWEEGLFPNQRAMDEGGNKGLEEERRLAYVGLTRARRRAIVSHAANRRIYANWQSQHSQPVHRGIAGRRCRADRRIALAARCGGDVFLRAISAGRTSAPGDRGLGAAGPARSGGRDPGQARECSTRSSATARCERWMTTNWTWFLKNQVTSAYSIAS